ncbi:iron-sulfur cluster assembly scaffold protein [Legionella bononiensis]|uniref:Iron-sulfur cluster assembly scaffold protein n=1 Tax=Legionella bononiensis TaxID=2793102 RepID=A0ABS1WCX8_9GAMM|nr:iron-sulfur cluster assembly scaffold protein [Legionella bononiensis]MBL7478983.1 iron-sulfur cluster assembly scaffold protein [Legionella bononiensis]MBL7527115.1 iron-sulfur cluster assembly scaffold protein [Legionella bononiensis]MBL7562084.1 iron-sulfur cluster assembly scaffold protein [Legionella bononiensis]
MMYNKIVQDCFFQPRHVGILDLTEPLVSYYRIEQQKPTVIIDLYIQCSRIGLITKACFKANGNPFVIAAMEWLCRRVEGTDVLKPESVNYQLLINELEIPISQYPVALLIEDVYKESLILMKKKLEGYES